MEMACHFEGLYNNFRGLPNKVKMAKVTTTCECEQFRVYVPFKENFRRSHSGSYKQFVARI
jgi:hypothetical protein